MSLHISIIHKCKTVPSKFVSSKSSCTQGMGHPSIPTRINVEQCVVLVWKAWQLLPWCLNTIRHCWDRQGIRVIQVCRWLARGTLEGRFETRVEDAFSGWLWLLHKFQVHSTSYDASFSCLELEQKTAPTSSLPLESQYNRMFLPAPLTLMWYIHPMSVERCNGEGWVKEIVASCHGQCLRI